MGAWASTREYRQVQVEEGDVRAREQLHALARLAREPLRTLLNQLLSHSPQEACTLFGKRLSHLEHTLAQCKGTQKEMLVKLGFIKKRADAHMMDSGDQVRHLYQEVDEGGLAAGARFTLREAVRTAERQPGVGIFCCLCWSAGKFLDLYLAFRDHQAAEAQAEAAAAAAAPVQVQMGAGAVPQNLAEMAQMLGKFWEAIQGGHDHSD